MLALPLVSLVCQRWSDNDDKCRDNFCCADTSVSLDYNILALDPEREREREVKGGRGVMKVRKCFHLPV